MATRKRAIGDDHNVAFGAVIAAGQRRVRWPFGYSPCSARSLRMRPPYMPIVFLWQIDFPLSCVDPRAAIPALAMLHLARFQEFKVPSTFSQVLFETVNKVIPDRHDGTLLTSGASGHQPSLSSRRICPVVK